jgi:hypothetical protein
MKKGLLIGCASCGLLFFVCCGGFLFWGYSEGTRKAGEQFAAAEQLWSSGKKAEAVDIYKSISQTFLGAAEREVVAERVREFTTEQTKSEVAIAHKEWAAGKREAAAARYKSLQLDLLDEAEQDTVRQRVKEFDLAKAKKDVEEANRLWTANDKAKAAAIYNDLPLTLLDRPTQEVVTRRLYETASQQWGIGRRAQAAAAYKRLDQDLLAPKERETVAERIKESDEREQQFARAKRTRHGKQVKLKAIELHYTSAVTADEARRLADFLDDKFGDAEKASTAQITKDGKTYQYRVVVKKGIELDEEAVALFKALALQLSLFVFEGETVEVHLCDDRLKTLRVVIPLNKT